MHHSAPLGRPCRRQKTKSVAAAVAGGENGVIESGRGTPGPAPLQHIYINITSFYISLAEGAHQRGRGGGVIVIPQDGESAEGTEKLVTATAVLLYNGNNSFSNCSVLL